MTGSVHSQLEYAGHFLEQTVLSWCEPEAASLMKGGTQTEGTPLHVSSKRNNWIWFPCRMPY